MRLLFILLVLLVAMASELQSYSSETDSRVHGISEPLYTNAKLTVLDSYPLLYQFFLRHSLSKLISLVSVHLPETTSQKAARSLYQLRQFFVTQFSDLIASPETYCSKCHFMYESDEDDCPHGCGQPSQRFWVVSIAAQIKRMLEG